MTEKNKKQTIKDKKCFFITPIGSEDSEEFKKLEAIKKNILEPVLKSFEIELIVAHDIHEIGSIGDQVFKNILDSKLIISNMTGLNPNVMYETAVAHSFGIPTIMICENGTKLPFDLTNDRTIFFDNSIEGSGKLMEQLKLKIPKNLGDKKADNPVYRVIDQFAIKEKVYQMEDSDPNKLVLEELNSLSEKIDYLNRQNLQKYENNIISGHTYQRSMKSNNSFDTFYFIIEADEVDIDFIDKKLCQLQNSLHGSIRSFTCDQLDFETNRAIISFYTNMKLNTLYGKLRETFPSFDIIVNETYPLK